VPVSDAELEAVASGSQSAPAPPPAPGGVSDADLEAIASGRPVQAGGPSNADLTAVASGTHPEAKQEQPIWQRLIDFGHFIKAAPEAAGKIAESYVQGSFPSIPLPKGWTADAVATALHIPIDTLDFLTSSKMQPTNLGNLIEAGQQAAEMTGIPGTVRLAAHPVETLERAKEKPFSTLAPVVQAGLTLAGGARLLKGEAAPSTTPAQSADVGPTVLPTPPPLEELVATRKKLLGGDETLKAAGLTDEDLAAAATREQRQSLGARGRESFAKQGASGEEVAKLSVGQAEELGAMSGEQATAKSGEILGQMRGAPPLPAEQAPGNFQAVQKQVYKNLEEQGLGGRSRKQMAEEITSELDKRGFVPGEKEPVPGFLTELTPEEAAGEAGAEIRIAAEHPKASPEAVTRTADIAKEPLPQETDISGPVPPGSPPRPPGAISDLLGRVSDLFGLRPKFFRQFERAPDLAAGVSRQMNANAWLDQQRKVLTEEAHRAVPLEADRVQGMRFLVSERGKLLEGGKVPVMEAAEEANMSPGAKKFVQWWMTEFQPKFERMSTGAGIESRVQTPSGAFTSLKALRPEDLVAGRHVGGYEPGRSGNLVAKYRKLKSGAAKEAKGTGELYSVDPDEMIAHNLELRTTQFARNQLIDTVKAYQVLPDAEGNVPRETKFLGVIEPVTSLEVNPGRPNAEVLKVPATVKRMYDEAQRPPTESELKAFDYLNRHATTVALLSPVEMATHTYNVVNALTTMPGGVGSKAMAALGPPGKWAEAIAKMANVNDANYATDLLTLTEFGGSRRGMIAEGKANRVLEATRAPVFGTRGVENLSRVAALRGLRAWAPELNDAQRVQIINNTMGTYAEKLQPGFVRRLKQVTPIVGQPFAAAGVAMAKTAGKSLLGLGAKGFSPEVALTAGSSIALWYAVNKAMDPEHRDPMRAGGPIFPSIRVSQGKNQTVDVSLPMLTGMTGRGARVLGVTGLYEGIRDGRKPQDTALLVLRNLENSALQLSVGPLGTLTTEALTGRRPYVTRGGSFLKVADESKTQPLLENLKAGVKGAGVWRAIPEEGQLTPESVAGKTAAIMAQLAAIPVTVKPGEKVQATAGIRGARGAMYEVARDIAQKAMNFQDRKQQHGYIESRLTRDLEGTELAMGRKAVAEIMKSMRRSQNRALGQLPKAPTPPSP